MERTNPPTAQTSARQVQYLVLYNLVSAILWFSVLGRVLLLIPLVGYENVYGGVGQFAKWAQTLAIMEIVHSGLSMSVKVRNHKAMAYHAFLY